MNVQVPARAQNGVFRLVFVQPKNQSPKTTSNIPGFTACLHLQVDDVVRIPEQVLASGSTRNHNILRLAKHVVQMCNADRVLALRAVLNAGRVQDFEVETAVEELVVHLAVYLVRNFAFGLERENVGLNGTARKLKFKRLQGSQLT